MNLYNFSRYFILGGGEYHSCANTPCLPRVSYDQPPWLHQLAFLWPAFFICPLYLTLTNILLLSIFFGCWPFFLNLHLHTTLSPSYPIDLYPSPAYKLTTNPFPTLFFFWQKKDLFRAKFLSPLGKSPNFYFFLAKFLSLRPTLYFFLAKLLSFGKIDISS